jgi:hypothetical protein
MRNHFSPTTMHDALPRTTDEQQRAFCCCVHTPPTTDPQRLQQLILDALMAIDIANAGAGAGAGAGTFAKARGHPERAFPNLQSHTLGRRLRVPVHPELTVSHG